MCAGQALKIFLIPFSLLCLQYGLLAQKDSAASRRTLEDFLKRQKGLVGNLAHNIINDNPNDSSAGAVNIERVFSPYEGRVIRNIYIQRLDFGEIIEDNEKNFSNFFTRLANDVHHKSREYVIRNNLFFKKGDKISAFLIADNERQLRNQPYIQDVSIFLINVYGTNDSVDVVVRTKDILSIGAGGEIQNTTSANISINEVNLGGWGNTLQVSRLYDQRRGQRSGSGLSYIQRNIGGSFIDAYASYTDFANTFNSGDKQETQSLIRFVRPLVNAYSKLTYILEAGNHMNKNMYYTDTGYLNNYRYHYYNYDAWLGWNTGAYKLGAANKNVDDRLRTLVSLRYFKQFFLTVPGKYASQYYYQYADIAGVLGAVSIFKQNFYKAKYFYGFGINEDVPEGTDLTVTAGWIDKQEIYRPYLGIDIQRSYFTPQKAYFNYIFRAGSYWGSNRIEDMNVLLDITHYSKLVSFGSKWKQRSVINASFTGQVNKVLNAPLSLESVFGLPEFRNSGLLGGDIRTTLKGESVFFSPINFLNFRFAPFAFGNLCLFTPVYENFSKSDLYSSIGGGFRTRNESLVFGTFEFKVFYYPRKNFYGENWRIETNTNIKFKYNSQLIKRPELINVN